MLNRISKVLKKIVLSVVLGVVVFTISAPPINADVYVNGYYRKNGTYVQPHYRSDPDSSPYNNFSYPGNTNPYTGKVAPGNANTYLNNYYDNDSSPSTFTPSLPAYAPPRPTFALPSPTPYFIPYTTSLQRSSSFLTPSVLGSQTRLPDYQVPEIVSREFVSLYGRQPTTDESSYWKYRARTDKTSIELLRAVMLYRLSQEGTPSASSPAIQVTGTTTAAAIPNAQVPTVVEAEFTKIFRHKPTKQESTYWKKRARTDKKTVELLRAAMHYWFNKGQSPQPNYVVIKNGQQVEMYGGYVDLKTNQLKK